MTEFCPKHLRETHPWSVIKSMTWILRLFRFSTENSQLITNHFWFYIWNTNTCFKSFKCLAFESILWLTLTRKIQAIGQFLT